MTTDTSKIAENIARVREKIELAAERSGRSANAVRLVAVTKYASPADGFIDALINAGCFEFGENRPQKLLEKLAVFGTDSRLRWHMIGSLQKNKIRKILGRVVLIHSVDSVELAGAIHRVAEEEQLEKIEILLEANISGDGNKHGLEPAELIDRLGEILAFRRLRVRGLMGMGGLDVQPSEVRRQFARLRTLLDASQRAFPAEPLDTLSMGMSGDFEIAIEEGATIVRIGSALY